MKVDKNTIRKIILPLLELFSIGVYLRNERVIARQMNVCLNNPLRTLATIFQNGMPKQSNRSMRLTTGLLRHSINIHPHLAACFFAFSYAIICLAMTSYPELCRPN
jgi:hypothetical protein